MPEPISFGELDFNLVASMGETHRTPKPETPFCILVIGDFSGRSSRGRERAVAKLKNLIPIPVDRDNLDLVLAKLGVEIHLPILGENAPQVCVRFSELDEFHPDALYRRMDVFQALKDTRESLEDPLAVLALTKALLKSPSPEEETISAESVCDPPCGNLLDQIIENSQLDSPQGSSAKPASQWDAFLSNIVRPHLVPKAHPIQTELIHAVDAASSELMQRILHHEAFQAVEAAWRGLDFLVSRLETDSSLSVFLLDMTKAELAADLTTTDDLSVTALYKLWVDPALEAAGAHPWAFIAGNYTFEKQNNDLALLGRMAKIAKAAGTCFLAAAGDRFLCKNSLAETPDPDDWQPLENKDAEDNWQTLRHLPEAEYIGLALPRMLLRLPYGAGTDPIDAFHFEEMPVSPVHQNYLWGNPCFALMLLLGQAFSLYGRQMQPDAVQQIHALPLHVYQKDGESCLMPCAETLLSRRAAEQMMEKGLMPLLSFLNQDMVRLGRFQSIRDPLTRLAGPWQ